MRHRELKETRFRLRVLARCGLLSKEHTPVLTETGELVKILARIVHNKQQALNQQEK